MATFNVESWLRHKGTYYKKGDKIEAELLNQKQQAQLVTRGVITRTADYADLGVVDELKDGNGNRQVGDDEPIETTLDLNFTADELKDGAKEQGLEFKGNISKAALIQLIVEENKEDYFLNQLDDDGEEDENI